MPTWRCPYCRTPQAEAARCWVCHRSSTSCATCADFRHAVYDVAGYCGLDRRRTPLVGDEIRACWSPPVAIVAGTAAVDPAADEVERTFDPALAPHPLRTDTDPLQADRPATFWVELEA